MPSSMLDGFRNKFRRELGLKFEITYKMKWVLTMIIDLILNMKILNNHRPKSLRGGKSI